MIMNTDFYDPIIIHFPDDDIEDLVIDFEGWERAEAEDFIRAYRQVQKDNNRYALYCLHMIAKYGGDDRV